MGEGGVQKFLGPRGVKYPNTGLHRTHFMSGTNCYKFQQHGAILRDLKTNKIFVSPKRVVVVVVIVVVVVVVKIIIVLLIVVVVIVVVTITVVFVIAVAVVTVAVTVRFSPA